LVSVLDHLANKKCSCA